MSPVSHWKKKYKKANFDGNFTYQRKTDEIIGHPMNKV